MRLVNATGIGLVMIFFKLGTAWCEEINNTIYLEADRVEIDEKQGISKYEGNVKLTRGDMSITADTMTAYKNSKELQRVLAVGNPVHFKRNATETQKEIRGQAQKLEFDAIKDTVVLSDNAKLWQDQNEFSGNTIKYNIAKELVTASGGSSKQERVHVIIHPKDKNAPVKH